MFEVFFVKLSRLCRLMCCSLFLLLSGFSLQEARATEHNTTLIDMDIVCNQHGAVLKINEGPLAGRTIYLGKNSDAASPGLAGGRWWTAASGYIIQLGDRSWRFNGDPPCF